MINRAQAQARQQAAACRAAVAELQPRHCEAGRPALTLRGATGQPDSQPDSQLRRGPPAAEALRPDARGE
jgi:hypothetical protein